jgi:alpha-beta hydrolase superfamily lysophospholipase
VILKTYGAAINYLLPLMPLEYWAMNLSKLENKVETGYISTKDNTKLFFRFFKPIKPKASLLLIHGFGEHSGRYLHVINQLVTEGFMVLSIDLRGHGNSQGSRGHIDTLERYEQDLESAIKFFNERRVGKLFFLAHSMGALISLRLIARQKVALDGLVLSSPLFAIKMPIPLWKKWASLAIMRIWPQIRVKTGIKGQHLSSDHAVAKAYDQDPLVLKNCSIQTFFQLYHGCQNSFSLATTTHHPIFLQLAGDDQVVDCETSKRWFSSLNLNKLDAQVKIYPQFLHEIYNEIGREQAINDAIFWLNQRAN